MRNFSKTQKSNVFHWVLQFRKMPKFYIKLKKTRRNKKSLLFSIGICYLRKFKMMQKSTKHENPLCFSFDFAYARAWNYSVRLSTCPGSRNRTYMFTEYSVRRTTCSFLPRAKSNEKRKGFSIFARGSRILKWKSFKRGGAGVGSALFFSALLFFSQHLADHLEGGPRYFFPRFFFPYQNCVFQIAQNTFS